jgi:hypothetical protein
MGFYTPYAVDQNLTPYSNAAKIRQLFVIPNAAERAFFYGVNFEFSYAMPQFSETRWNMEIRPIVGWRKGDYEFIINPIVDIGFGQNGGAEFAPCARFARNFGENLAIGLEYYTDLGTPQNWLPFNEQQHNLYAVVDFKIGRFVGYGLTPGSDRLMYKMIIGTDLNEGVSDKADAPPLLTYVLNELSKPRSKTVALVRQYLRQIPRELASTLWYGDATLQHECTQLINKCCPLRD